MAKAIKRNRLQKIKIKIKKTKIKIRIIMEETMAKAIKINPVLKNKN